MIVSPSLLAADRSALLEEAKKMEEVGAQYIHIDIMDGEFVEGKTWDSSLVASLKGKVNLVLDTHLMMLAPWKHIDSFLEAGSDILTLHYEVFDSKEELIGTLRYIRENGAKAGLSIKPETPVEAILPFLPYCDLVLIMSVEPGKGGQPFMKESLDRIAYLKKKRDSNPKEYKYLIEVDGGIREDSAKACAEAGVDILVSGTYLYGSKDYKERLKGLLSL